MTKNELINLLETIETGEEYKLEGFLNNNPAFPYEFGLKMLEIFGEDHILFGAYGGADTRVFCLYYQDVEDVANTIIKYIERENIDFSQVNLITV